MHDESSAIVQLRCPVCRSPLDDGELTTCARCETPVHRACGREIGGCVRFACELAATPRSRLLKCIARTSEADAASAVGNAAYITALSGMGLATESATGCPWWQWAISFGILLLFWGLAATCVRAHLLLERGELPPAKLKELLDLTRARATSATFLVREEDLRTQRWWRTKGLGIVVAASALTFLMGAPGKALFILLFGAGYYLKSWSDLRARVANEDATWMLEAWKDELLALVSGDQDVDRLLKPRGR